MSPLCPPPDASVGVAIRLDIFMSCQARVLGENGYLALTGGPLGVQLLTAVLTVFVALVGYRFLLGSPPGFREGVSWTARVGIALTLFGSWPAFQTVIYRVMIDGPNEIAAIVMTPSGLPETGRVERVQAAYDTIRLGSIGESEPRGDPGLEQRFSFGTPAPRSATAFLLSAIGIESALRFTIGLLLAIGPLPILTLILSGSAGLFVGWFRVLTGTALALVGAIAASSTELVLVESELARLQAFRGAAGSTAIDPTALPALTLIFVFVSIAAVLAATRVAGMIDFRWVGSHLPMSSSPDSAARERLNERATTTGSFVRNETNSRSREQRMAEALSRASERNIALLVQSTSTPGSPSSITTSIDGPATSRARLGARRLQARRTRSAARRDSNI